MVDINLSEWFEIWAATSDGGTEKVTSEDTYKDAMRVAKSERRKPGVIAVIVMDDSGNLVKQL